MNSCQVLYTLSSRLVDIDEVTVNPQKVAFQSSALPSSGSVLGLSGQVSVLWRKKGGPCDHQFVAIRVSRIFPLVRSLAGLFAEST